MEKPTRIIMDSSLRTPDNANVLNTEDAPTILVCSDDVSQEKSIYLQKKVLQFYPYKNEYGLQIDEMLEKLYIHGITDILLEGGSKMNASFYSKVQSINM